MLFSFKNYGEQTFSQDFDISSDNFLVYIQKNLIILTTIQDSL